MVDSGNDAKDADGETVKVTIKDHDDFTIDQHAINFRQRINIRQ